MPGGLKLRRSPRYQMTVAVSYRNPCSTAPALHEGSGRTRDLGYTGACLELTEALSTGMSLELVFQSKGEEVSLDGEVVWVGHPRLPSGGTLHGVAFPHLSQDQRYALRGLIQQKGRLRSRTSRIPAALPMLCRPLGAAGDPLQGWTGDLSWEGCSLLLPDRLPVGTLVEVVLTTQRGDFSAKATVVWVDPATGILSRDLTRHGVRFAEVRWTRESVLDLILEPTPTGAEPEQQED